MMGPDEVTKIIIEGTGNVPDKVVELFGIIPRAVQQIF